MHVTVRYDGAIVFLPTDVGDQDTLRKMSEIRNPMYITQFDQNHQPNYNSIFESLVMTPGEIPTEKV